MICATLGVSQWAPIAYVWHIKENMRRTLKNKIIAESKSMRNLLFYFMKNLNYDVMWLVDNDILKIYSS